MSAVCAADAAAIVSTGVTRGPCGVQDPRTVSALLVVLPLFTVPIKALNVKFSQQGF